MCFAVVGGGHEVGAMAQSGTYADADGVDG